MFDRHERGGLAIGVMMLTPDREMIEVLGYAGLDFVCIDMMVTPWDWHDAAASVLAAARHDVTPWLRIPTYPWNPDYIDQGLAVQTLRALSIGAECVLASVNTAAQVEQMLHPLGNPHRRYYIKRRGPSGTADQQRFDERDAPQRVIPIIESDDALQNLEEILALDGVRQIYLGMGDLTRLLGHPGEVTHPDVLRVLDDVVVAAQRRGAQLAVNTVGFESPDGNPRPGVRAEIELLRAHGADAIIVPRPTLVLQEFYEDLSRTAHREERDGSAGA